jgi:hypothetical protein
VKNRPIWKTDSSVEPAEATVGSTSVACWLLALVKVSVLRRASSDGGGGGFFEPPLSPEFESELELDPEPQPNNAASSIAAIQAIGRLPVAYGSSLRNPNFSLWRSTLRRAESSRKAVSSFSTPVELRSHTGNDMHSSFFTTETGCSFLSVAFRVGHGFVGTLA